MNRLKILLSWLLIAGGSYFLLRGMREYFVSYVAQARAASSWRPNVAAVSQPLRPGDVFARISIPRLRTALYVVEGTGQDELRRGPGHLEGSAMPGAAGNCIIAGHRDTHFRALEHIHAGDRVEVRTADGTYTYRVSDISIVPPNDTSPLNPSRQPELHLITCYPFRYVGNAPKRFVMRADLVSRRAASSD